MSIETTVLIILAVNFGFVAGALWATRDREDRAEKTQPYESAWGNAAYYDRMTKRFREAEGKA